MATIKISFPASLQAFVDEQVSGCGYGAGDEYLHGLIRRYQQRLHLRASLLAGADSPPREPTDGNYFEALRERVRIHAARARTAHFATPAKTSE